MVCACSLSYCVVFKLQIFIKMDGNLVSLEPKFDQEDDDDSLFITQTAKIMEPIYLDISDISDCEDGTTMFDLQYDIGTQLGIPRDSEFSAKSVLESPCVVEEISSDEDFTEDSFSYYRNRRISNGSNVVSR